MREGGLGEVHIIAQGMGSDKAPKEGENWGINDTVLHHNLTMLFHMHDFEQVVQANLEQVKKNIGLLNEKVEGDNEWLRPLMNSVFQDYPISVIAALNTIKKRVNELGIPLIGVKKYEDVPTSEAYPIDEITEALGSNYFTNGISYVIAYAIWKGAKKISLWGATIFEKNEALHDRANIEFWVGIATAKGIEVEFKGDIPLMRTHNDELYGFNYARQYGVDPNPHGKSQYTG